MSERLGEIVIRFNERGEIVAASGREIDEKGHVLEGGFYVSKSRISNDQGLKFYIDWYKDYLKEGEKDG